jgi:hypothetical protein
MIVLTLLCKIAPGHALADPIAIRIAHTCSLPSCPVSLCEPSPLRSLAATSVADDRLDPDVHELARARLGCPHRLPERSHVLVDVLPLEPLRAFGLAMLGNVLRKGNQVGEGVAAVVLNALN